MRGELWTIIGLLLTNAGFLFGMWKYFDARISRVYARFDEHKTEISNTFVRKDNCQLLHNNTAENLRGVEQRMTDKFKELEKKIDESFKLILELLRTTKFVKEREQ